VQKDKNMLKDISNRAKGGYLLWVVAHLFLLFAVSDGMFDKRNYDGGIDDFIPFTAHYGGSEVVVETDKKTGETKQYISEELWWDIHNYDITEFLFYLIVPVLLYFAYKLLQPQAEPKPSDHWKQYQKPKEDE